MEKNNFSDISLLNSANSSLLCDCVNFSPNFESDSLVAVGLYQLNEKESLTIGGFSLYSLKKMKLDLVLEEIFDAGVLDLKWISFGGKSLLVCGCNDGKIRIFEISNENNGGKIKKERILEIPFEEEVTSREILQSHEYTPWVCCFCPETPNTFLSGGDDMKLNLYDLRSENKVIQTNKKTHTMGISALKFTLNDQNHFYSGSFDQYIRLWDVRKINSAIMEHKTDGGVWRIVESQKRNVLFLGLSFANEFEILKFGLGDSNIESLGKIKEHNSLAYGLDFEDNSGLLVTSSFYDKKICLWQLTNK